MHSSTRQKTLVFLIFGLSTVLQQASCNVTVSTHDVELRLHEKTEFSLQFTNYEGPFLFDVQHTDIVRITPSFFNIENCTEECYRTIVIEAIGAGHSEVVANETVATQSVSDAYVRVTIHKNPSIDTVSLVIGWIYFAAWSISFYPQIYINYQRRSVVGLNFDFLALNITGFILYSVFNLGLYFIPEMKEEYSSRYPRGLNPIQVNDIVFAVHAVAATIITIIQCFFYTRDNQRISITARSIMSIFGVFLFISIILAGVSVIHWLDFLYYCSYVKLAITLIKYVPQAYMNYRRKSTVGWSIGNIFLDFTGGMLSMLQMILNAYNYDDWVSIFGDPTKFGLGLFSVVFDIFFIVQHYILYRNTNYEDKSTASEITDS